MYSGVEIRKAGTIDNADQISCLVYAGYDHIDLIDYCGTTAFNRHFSFGCVQSCIYLKLVPPIK